VVEAKSREYWKAYTEIAAQLLETRDDDLDSD
jgi:5-methylcytosine-specific restriction endonuclease McrBC regulatory subunit McrC